MNDIRPIAAWQTGEITIEVWQSSPFGPFKWAACCSLPYSPIYFSWRRERAIKKARRDYRNHKRRSQKEHVNT